MREIRKTSEWGLVVGLASAMLAGCAGMSSSSGDMCLNDLSSRPVLDELEKQVDAITPAKKHDTHAIETGCLKRTYSRGDYKLIIYRRETWDPQRLEGVVRPLRAAPENAEECLTQAVGNLTRLGNPSLTRVVEKGKAKVQWRWNDSDIGPVASLACGAQGTAAYYDSLATFAHELARDISDNDCVYSSGADNFLCFGLSGDLPTTRIARLNVEVPDREVGRSLASIQDTYFNPTMERRPFSLIEEMNAHIVSMETYTAILKTRGKEALYPTGRSRRLHGLSLFMDETLIYLGRLQQHNPRAFEDNFGRGTTNRDSLHQLLQRAEAAYNAWRLAANDVESQDSDVASTEAAFYNNYLEAKGRLGM